MSQIWNAFKAASKIKLGLANPYRIDPKYCLLSENQNNLQVKFLQKQKVNRNTYLMRFALPDPDKCLGLMIGQFVRIKIGEKSRPYNPISRIDEPGIVDFFIQDLQKINQNSFTAQLLGLKEGESVTLEGPRTQYVYHGYGKMEWKDSPPKVYKHIGIVAYESIITGVYTLIDSIMPNYDDKVGVSLLWVGEEPDDFIFLEEFSMLSEQLRLNFNVMLRTSKPGWIGPFGKVNSSHIKSFMPPPGDQTAFILFGGPDDIDYLSPIVKEMGYKHILTTLLKDQ